MGRAGAEGFAELIEHKRQVFNAVVIGGDQDFDDDIVDGVISFLETKDTRRV